jgi:hypothetical protein
MKYRIIIFMVVCTALLIAGCGNKEPLAPDSKELAINRQDAFLAKGPNVKITPWEGVETRQEITDPGQEWVSEDNVWHIRSRVQVDIIESDEIRIAGISTITWDADMNLITGDGVYTSKCVHKPSAFEGTWEGRLIGELKKFMFTGQGTARGTGEFEGMRMTLQIHETPPPYIVCPVSGFIIERN